MKPVKYEQQLEVVFIKLTFKINHIKILLIYIAHHKNIRLILRYFPQNTLFLLLLLCVSGNAVVEMPRLKN